MGLWVEPGVSASELGLNTEEDLLLPVLAIARFGMLVLSGRELG